MRRSVWQGILLCSVLLGLWAPAWAVTRYASPSGSGSACTNINTPCQFTTAANQLQAGDVLQLRHGTHLISTGNNTYNTPSTGGSSEGTRIIIESFPGETATLSGAIAINAPWYTIRQVIFDGSAGSNNLHTAAGGNYTTLQVPYTHTAVRMGSHHGRIEQTEITRYAYGFLQSPDNSPHNEFLHNHVHEICLVDNCAAAYITGGSPFTFTGNRVENMVGNVACWKDSQVPGSVHDCTFSQNTFQNLGIFWDETSNNGTPEGSGSRYAKGAVNPRAGSSIQLTRGTGHKAINNVLINSPGIMVAHQASDCDILNNSMSGMPMTAGVPGYDPSNQAAILMQDVNATSTNCRVRNNLVWTPQSTLPTIFMGPGSNNHTVTHNVVSAAITNHGSGNTVQTNAVGVNPQFMNASQGDLRLAAGSPAINTGVTLALVPTDFLDVARPQGAAYDPGAYEFVDEAPPEPLGNVAWWKFDENTGAAASDSSGQGHTFTAQGQAGWTAPGALGPSGTWLDGTADFWTAPLTAALKPPSQFSITGWIRPESGPGEVFSAGDAYGAEVSPTGDLFCYFYTGSTFISVQGTGVDLFDGAWHHIGCVKDASGLLVYIDGLLRNSLLVTGSISYTLGSQALVGRSATVPGEFDYGGAIDHLRIYDQGISQQGYLNDYNERVPEAGFTVTHCTYTLADAVLGFPRGSIDTDLSNALSTPIGIQCGVQYAGSPPTPAAETFTWHCSVNGGAFTALTNSHGTLGVRVHTDLGVTMGQTIPAASGLLPLDGFTAIDGVVTADTLASAPIAMLTGQQAAVEVRIDMAAPVDDNDTIQCRPHRQDGSVMTYRAGAIRTMQLLPDARGVVRSGNRIQGGKAQ